MKMKVDILAREEIHRGFFRLEKIRLRFQRFDGKMSREVAWETLVRDDAVAVVLYDPRADVVILIRQFRLGAYLAEDAGWCVEIVAGNCPVATDFAAAARREVREETGWEVRDLHAIASYYVSPNASTERLHLYLGVIDSRARSESGGGLLHEDEDIQVLPLPFEEVMAWMAAGRINTGTALLGLHWLALHRQELRQRSDSLPDAANHHR